MPRRTAPPRRPAVPPHTAEEGAARITAAAVPIFDASDGHGADWRLLVESMFRAAFVMLDGLPEDDRRKIARRVHEGSYNRCAPGPIADLEADKPDPDGMASALLDTAGLKSKGPRPPH